MKESEIQSIIETIIEEGRFLDIIEDKSIIEERYQSLYSDEILPSFLINYLSTKRAIVAAKNILESLEDACIISTASKSISIDRKQKLLPDLILFNEIKREFIVIEIKRSDKTARETITEILAYEHEIKNILPFLSNYEVNFCIISTDYTSLLEHAISGLITWESRQILCLKIELKQLNLKLNIHIPSAWTLIGGTVFPQKAISTSKIILYHKNDGQTFADTKSAVFYAANLIAREADRNNSHGFALIWYDCWESSEVFAGSDKFHLTVGIVNPYVFIPFAQNIGIIDALKSPLANYFIKNSEEFTSAHLSNEKILGTCIRYLEQYFNVQIENLSYWEVERIKAYQTDYVLGSSRYRELPLHIEFWGSLGDFVREYICHPGVKKNIMSGISNKAIKCEDPFIGIPILDTITGINKFDPRGFTCKVLFELGAVLGSICSLYHIAIQNSGEPFKPLQSAIIWYILDAQATLQEITIRYKQSSDILVPHPAIKVRTTGDFESGLSSIVSYIEWIYKNFLPEENQIHEICFELGLKSHPLLDPYLPVDFAELEREKLEDYIYNTSIYLLKSIAEECLAEEAFYSDIINTLFKDFIESESNKFTTDQILGLIEKIPKTRLLKLYHTNLMNLLDEIVIPVNHNNNCSINLSDYKSIDWKWVKETMLKMSESGTKLPALQINANGEIRLIDYNQEYEFMPIQDKIDLKENFIFIVSLSDIMRKFEIKKWKEVIL